MIKTPPNKLIAQGTDDRMLYFVESGMLTVHFEDAGGKIRFREFSIARQLA